MNVLNGIESVGKIFPSEAASSSPVKQSDLNTQSKELPADQSSVSTAASQVALSANEPEVRLNKVASIQSALQAGTYQVPASDVAEKLIQTMTAES